MLPSPSSALVSNEEKNISFSSPQSVKLVLRFIIKHFRIFHVRPSLSLLFLDNMPTFWIFNASVKQESWAKCGFYLLLRQLLRHDIPSVSFSSCPIPWGILLSRTSLFLLPLQIIFREMLQMRVDKFETCLRDGNEVKHDSILFHQVA